MKKKVSNDVSLIRKKGEFSVTVTIGWRGRELLSILLYKRKYILSLAIFKAEKVEKKAREKNRGTRERERERERE